MTRTAEDWGRVAVGLHRWPHGTVAKRRGVVGWVSGVEALSRMLPPVDRLRVIFVAELGTTTLYQVVAPGGYPQIRMVNGRHEFVPDPDDPATAGCMLALLSPECHRVTTGIEDDESWAWWDGGEWHDSATLGRACIAAAEALGRWPGGEE
jgi:hypothetical protein